jgi:hypothetical protein
MCSMILILCEEIAFTCSHLEASAGAAGAGSVTGSARPRVEVLPDEDEIVEDEPKKTK